MADRPSTSQTNVNDLMLNESTITTIVRRIYDSVQSMSEEKPSSETRSLSENASVEQEMSQRFSLPRRSSGNGGGLNSNSRPRYNPNTNYGHGSTSSRKDGKSKGSKGKTGKATREHIHRKELILLPHPTYDHVPRFDHKRKLQ